MSRPDDAKYCVSLTVLCATEEAALRVVELLSRPLVGMAIDNLHGSLTVTPVSEEDIDNSRP